MIQIQFTATMLVALLTPYLYHPSSDIMQEVGGQCEGCEAVFEYGDAKLSSVASLPDVHDPGPKMEISGTVYHRDGKTPAADVILYIYHTDQKGEYPTKGNEKGWDKRHGYIRGWVKTGPSGRYKFLTLMPAPYPGRNAPAHVHAIVKEPGINPYWIDEYLFESDPLLTAKERAAQQKRGGAGIMVAQKGGDGTIIIKRDIVLGLNIPDYPKVQDIKSN